MSEKNVLSVNSDLSAISKTLESVRQISADISKSIATSFGRIEDGVGDLQDGLADICAPQIPYLAKGAVLPANRPFLAVVGDQKHGTNVEAPLATIQEAVSVALDSRMGAMMEIFRDRGWPFAEKGKGHPLCRGRENNTGVMDMI